MCGTIPSQAHMTIHGAIEFTAFVAHVQSNFCCVATLFSPLQDVLLDSSCCVSWCAIQVQVALGNILRQSKARELPCGVFGSFGWSGEAVDEMESRLKDAGFAFAFKPIRVKFKPTAKV